MATEQEMADILVAVEATLGERERRVKLREEALSEGGPKTLRDYFAAQALSGLIANHMNKGSAADVSRLAFGIADAMLAARSE